MSISEHLKDILFKGDVTYMQHTLDMSFSYEFLKISFVTENFGLYLD